ncbi:MAG TPA: glycine cleavage system protein GcvH, partial [Pyrinomonadaceae bacterium]|jgi:glycine cleavage system H protein|nr:glycine cleavage system protein GcvH [Pyrinomonadaceae bacterium]
MANVPENLRYSKDHEWVRVEGETATIGISDYAQESLGDVVYVDLPKEGATFAAHESIGSVESVKAVSDIFTPVGGEVLEVNEALNDSPETVNSDPYGEAWMAKIRLSNPAEVDELMDAAAYQEYLDANA